MDGDGLLVRDVRLSDGKRYTHRCTCEVYEAVAMTYADGHGHTLNELAETLDAPFTQVNIAIEFMKERGVIEVREKRRTYAASGCVYEDAMVELTALESKPRR